MWAARVLVGVTVEVLGCSVVAHGGPGVGVSSGDLDIVKRVGRCQPIRLAGWDVTARRTIPYGTGVQNLLLQNWSRRSR